MKRLWQQIIGGERGQALPIVLSVMIIGGLMIVPALNHISTSLNAGRMVEENVKGVYAADAGVENALWYLTKQLPESIPEQLPEPVNQMQVEIPTEPKGKYALYYGKLQELSTQQTQQDHYKFLTVNGEMGEWDAEAEAYPYTITVTRQPEAAGEVIQLGEVGVRLLIGYDYVEGSTADFDDNLSKVGPDEPIEQDGAGAQMLVWGFKGSGPEVLEGEPPRTQTFYVTGEGEQDGDYTWVGAKRQDIGAVGEITGTLYSITAKATQDGKNTAIVRADVIVYETEGETEVEIRIISWQINPE